jgi:hypothetical protein
VFLYNFQLSHQQFWQRFLFRKALLEDEEARQQVRQRRLEEEKTRAQEEVQKSEQSIFVIDLLHAARFLINFLGDNFYCLLMSMS